VTITFVRMSYFFLFSLGSSPWCSGADDVTRSGLVYHLFRNKGDSSRCSCSPSGHSCRYFIVGRTGVRLGLFLRNPGLLTFDVRGALAGSLISFGSAPFELVKVWLSLHVTEPPTVLMTSAYILSPHAMMRIGPTSTRVFDRCLKRTSHLPAPRHSRSRPRHYEDPRIVRAVHRIQAPLRYVRSPPQSQRCRYGMFAGPREST